MVRDIPEVESYSRRTGLQLGLAAVTEANTGDIAVKLKTKRSRSVDDVISDLRARSKQEEPGIDVEFVQVLQDMIGDLSNAPEPVQIKLFSPDAATLNQWAPQVADAIGKVPGVVDILNGIDNTISNPATVFQVNPDGRGACRLHARRGRHRCDGDSGRRACSHPGHHQRHRLYHPRALSRRVTAAPWTR